MKTALTPLLTMLLFTLAMPSGAVAKEPKPLKLGDKAPLFEALDFKAQQIKLTKLLKDGPVVLVFLRGFS